MFESGINCAEIEEERNAFMKDVAKSCEHLTKYVHDMKESGCWEGLEGPGIALERIAQTAQEIDAVVRRFGAAAEDFVNKQITAVELFMSGYIEMIGFSDKQKTAGREEQALRTIQIATADAFEAIRDALRIE